MNIRFHFKSVYISEISICVLAFIAVFIVPDFKANTALAIILWFIACIVIFIWNYYSPSQNFICPNCLHSILTKNIKNVACPACRTEGHNRIELFTKCHSCDSIIQFYSCPHCGEAIDLLAPYNHKQLINRRNNNE